MPSSYSPPDVIVTQVQRTQSAPRITPPLPVVVVGPSTQIAVKAFTGNYSAGSDFIQPLPGLASGAVVNPSSVGVFLTASDLFGKNIGTFQLPVGTGYALTSDSLGNPAGVHVYGNLALEYSLIASSNNNVNTISPILSTGTPNGLTLTDSKLDFASHGATADGTTFITISSPSAQAGRFAVRSLINGSGTSLTAVNSVRVEQVNPSTNAAILQKSFTVGAGLPISGQVIYGLCSNHVQASSFTKTSNVTASTLNGTAETITANTYGIGVTAAPLATLTSTEADLMFTSGLQSGATATVLPSRRSSQSYWFKVATADPVAHPTWGTNGTGWAKIVAQAQVGRWLRFVGTWANDGSSSGLEVRDYKILSVDLANNQLLLQNPDADVTVTSSMTPGVTGINAVVTSDITAIEVLQVMVGNSDSATGAGDYLTIAGVDYSIYRATPYLIELSSAVSISSSTPVTAIRGIANLGGTVQYDLRKTLASGYTGTIATSYEAARSDLALNGPIQIASIQDVETYLGVIHPDNPLAFGAAMVVRGGGATSGRIFYAASTASSGVADYQAAFDQLQTLEDAYWILPLSQSADVHAALKAHVDSMSLPTAKGERLGFINSALPAPTQVIPAAALTSSTTPPSGVVSADKLSLTAPSVDWTLAVPGQLIWVIDQTTHAQIASYRIKSINYATGVVSVYNPFPTAAATVYFTVNTFTMSKADQATAWQNYASGFADRRVYHVVPDQCLITFTDKTQAVVTDTQVLVPGYYAVAAFLGYRSSVSPSTPVTHVMVPGVDALVHSNTYFLPDQLNVIASGGSIILTQRTANAPVTIRQQLSTDMSSIENRELSIVVAVDFMAKAMRTGLRPYIGRNNITAELLTQLRGISESIINSLVASLIVRKGTQLTRLAQNVNSPDEVDLDVDTLVYYPCNRISVTLYV